MKLSGHSYNNDVFNSLMDGMKDDIVLKKKAQQAKDPTLTGSDIFSSTTEKQFSAIQEEEMKVIAAELQFAADKSKVAISGSDLVKFSKDVMNKGLRGKDLERAASKYCNNIDREIALPQSACKVQNIDIVAEASRVIPAGYNTEDVNNSKTGGYMGMSKNPNTIWDTDALQRFATKTDDVTQMMGDERIADHKKKEAAYQESLETTTEVPADLLPKGDIMSASTGQEVGTSQSLPQNAMSIFTEDKDFTNIPEKTAGEMLKEQSEGRANKKAEAKNEWNKIASVQKTGTQLLSDQEEKDLTNSVSRASVDKLFEGFAHLVKEEE